MKKAEELNSGAYQLHILIKKDFQLQVGVLGLHSFLKGNYIYTGSAMKNLMQRVDRHLRLDRTKDKSILRWHIDFLLTHENVEITKVEYFRSVTKEECNINQMLIKQINAKVPVKGFGSSDCKICESHLVYFY